MTLRQLASLIAKREKKKVSVSIGNIREVLRIIIDIQKECLMDKSIQSFPSFVIAKAAVDQLEKKRAKRQKKGRGR